MYNNMKIGAKLLAGFLLVAGIGLVIGLIGIVKLTQVDNLGSRVYEKMTIPLIYMGNANEDILKCHLFVSETLAHQSNMNHHTLVDSVRARLDDFDEQMDLYEPTLIDKSDSLYLVAMRRAKNVFGVALAPVLSNIEAGNDSLAQYARRHSMSEEDALLKLLNIVTTYNIESARKASDQRTATAQNSTELMVVCILLGFVISIAIALLLSRSIALRLGKGVIFVKQIEETMLSRVPVAEAIAQGDFSREIVLTQEMREDEFGLSLDEAGMMTRSLVNTANATVAFDRAFLKMTLALRKGSESERINNWLKTSLNDANNLMRGEKSSTELSEGILTFVAKCLGAAAGALYLFDTQEQNLRIGATYALTRRKSLDETFAIGEGLIGQAAREHKIICLTRVPADFLPIVSATGEGTPCNVLAIPLIRNNDLVGVMELASFQAFTDVEMEFLNQIADGLSIALAVAESRVRVGDLLGKSQQQTEELRVQQEELQQTNEELEERAQMLELQREQIAAKNKEIEAANEEVVRKAQELEKISTYKSEFLANMSHELRSPLNSLLILSSLLRDNEEGNLTEKQVRFAATIYDAGNDLLNLISDILDLSKIESGKIELVFEDTSVHDICNTLDSLFRTGAEQKHLAFTVEVAESVPEVLRVDVQRVQQILRNLLSNACKFTESGSVHLGVTIVDAKASPLLTRSIAFSVVDSGIGIAPETQKFIFEAFKQADGSTSRKYGGTGLGLSISLKLALTMKGCITVNSELEKGSTFTFWLPLASTANSGMAISQPAQMASKPIAPLQASTTTVPDGKAILIIEDDQTFASVLAERVRDKGFHALVAPDGELGISLAEQHLPSAIILDIGLPGMDGWGVMRLLKDNPKTRHIPVHFLSGFEDSHKAMYMGAVGFLTKPINAQDFDGMLGTIEIAISKTMRRLLLVEDNAVEAMAIKELLSARAVEIVTVPSGKDAILHLVNEHFDCIVLDLGLSDMTGFELLEHINDCQDLKNIPVIIHSGKDLSREEEARLRGYASRIIIKGAKSSERLLNEVTLFLHLVESGLSSEKQKMIRNSLDKEATFEGKKVLIVDDDMRNLFSLSNILAAKNMVIWKAGNGREALRSLDEMPAMDIVLMDIMMPEMDGFEAMKTIRADSRFSKLPLIAMTAKALKGDREKCIESGANDYISKPIDMNKLYSLMRIWLHR